MALQAKSRYSSFKESETQKKDENICNLSKLAVKVLNWKYKRTF